MVKTGSVICAILAITSVYGAWTGSMTDSITLSYKGMFPETTKIDSRNDRVISGAAIDFRLFAWPESSLTNGNTVVPTAGDEATNERGSIFGICYNGKKTFAAVTVIDGTAPGGVARFDTDTLKFEKVIRIGEGINVGSLYCDGSKIFALSPNTGRIYVCDDDLDGCDLVGESELLKPATFIGA
jgi:hypothetical protein